MLIAHLTGYRGVRASADRESRRIGLVHPNSRYLGAPMAMPLLARSADGNWGKVHLPWDPQGRVGWINLTGMRLSSSDVHVVVHRATHELDVYRGGRMVTRLHAGTGAAATPTPAGSFYVTERVAVPAAQRAGYGSYAFGLSGRQTHLPRGWRGGDQLAIHGTGDASTIGRSASAGCVHISERGLVQLRRLLVPGTRVDIRN